MTSDDKAVLTDLHTATKTEDEMQSRLLLNVVVGESTAILKLLACEDQALLVWWNALLILNLALDIVDSVRGLHLKGDSLSCHCTDVSRLLGQAEVVEGNVEDEWQQC